MCGCVVVLMCFPCFSCFVVVVWIWILWFSSFARLVWDSVNGVCSIRMDIDTNDEPEASMYKLKYMVEISKIHIEKHTSYQASIITGLFFKAIQVK